MRGLEDPASSRLDADIGRQPSTTPPQALRIAQLDAVVKQSPIGAMTASADPHRQEVSSLPRGADYFHSSECHELFVNTPLIARGSLGPRRSMRGRVDAREKDITSSRMAIKTTENVKSSRALCGPL